MAERPPTYLQENLLTLLVWDEEYGKFVRNALPDPYYFESVYHDIAVAAYSFIDQYDSVPKEHIADLLDGEFDKDAKGKLLKSVIFSLVDNRNRVQPKFVLDSLEHFVRQQKLKEAIMDCAELVQSSDSDALDKVESVLHQAATERLRLFDPGTFLSDKSRALKFLDLQEESFRTGVRELDEKGIGPIRGGLNLLIALPKMGKSWWMVNLGKQSWKMGLNVCHITLEMSEDLCAQRYMQAMFVISKREQEYQKLLFDVNDKGYFSSFMRFKLKPRLALTDVEIEKKLHAKLDQWGDRLGRIVIKQFPTGQLTIPELVAYLDNLELTRKFVPDLLIIDYPDLMRVDTDNYRHDIGRIYKELRGIAIKRNIGIAAVSQSNRYGEQEDVIKDVHVGEDFSKIFTADSVLTYNQTKEERNLGLARIFVADARNDEDKFTVLVSQNYSTGQFCLDSIRLFDSKRYSQAVDEEIDNPSDIMDAD